MPTDTLILGACGFIGQHLARLLPSARRPGRAELDLRDAGGISAALRAWRPRRVFNLAGYGARPGQQDPVAMYTLNTLLPGRLREGLEALGGPRVLVQAGSIAEEGPSPYGASKRAGSRAAQGGAGDSEVITMNLRLFQVFGPAEAQGRLLPSLRALARGELSAPLALGDPNELRDWLFVEDAAALMLGLSTEPRSGTVELGGGRLRSVSEVVDLAAGLLRLDPADLVWNARPPSAMQVPPRPADLNELRERLGPLSLTPFEQSLALSLGLSRTQGP